MKLIHFEDTNIYFAKKYDDVIIPSKRNEDAGFDVYARFEEDKLVIKPHETVKIPTGLVSAFSPKWRIQLKERGSTGTKGIAQRSGVIDSGYRGEWLVPITNTTDKTIVIAKKDVFEQQKDFYKDHGIIYPYEKAICQAVVVEVPKSNVIELALEEVLLIPSERGEGNIGSSGK